MKARDVAIVVLLGLVAVLGLNLWRERQRSAELELDRDRLYRALAHQ